MRASGAFSSAVATRSFKTGSLKAVHHWSSAWEARGEPAPFREFGASKAVGSFTSTWRAGVVQADRPAPVRAAAPISRAGDKPEGRPGRLRAPVLAKRIEIPTRIIP